MSACVSNCGRSAVNRTATRQPHERHYISEYGLHEKIMAARSWSGRRASSVTLLQSRRCHHGLKPVGGLSFAVEPRRRAGAAIQLPKPARNVCWRSAASIVRHRLHLPRLSPLSGYAERKLPAAKVLGGCRFLFALEKLLALHPFKGDGGGSLYLCFLF